LGFDCARGSLAGGARMVMDSWTAPPGSIMLLSAVLLGDELRWRSGDPLR